MPARPIKKNESLFLAKNLAPHFLQEEFRKRKLINEILMKLEA